MQMLALVRCMVAFGLLSESEVDEMYKVLYKMIEHEPPDPLEEGGHNLKAGKIFKW